MEEPLRELDNTAQCIGMIINPEKTKYMTVIKKTHNQFKQMTTGMCRFARDSCFSYLGSIINDTIIISDEITDRIKERK